MALNWNPDNPTQLAVACDDNRFPYINIWDLRKPAAPISVLSGFHSAGILDLSWCTQDPNYLLASSKDKVVCWNIKLGEPMQEMDSQAINRIKWSPELKAHFIANTADGIVNVYSAHDLANPALFKSKKASEITAPVWLQRKVGGSFGFGGKIVTFSGTKDKTASVINISTLPTDLEFHKLAKDFETLTLDGSYEKLCSAKVLENSENASVNMEWRFLQALAENKKEVLLSALGFDPQQYAIFNEI